MRCRCVFLQFYRNSSHCKYFLNNQHNKHLRVNKYYNQKRTLPSLVCNSIKCYSTTPSENTSKEKPSFLSAFQTAENPDSKKTAEEINEEIRKTEEERKNKDEKQKRTMKISFYVVGGSFLGMGLFFVGNNGPPKKDEEGNEIKDEFSELPIWRQYMSRSWNEAKFMKKSVIEPSREKLLPDPLKEPYYQPPFTLVLELKHILVHPDWTYQTGWRFKKRPGVDFFLEHIGPPLFEVVIYTSENGPVGYPIAQGLDPKGYIWYHLFKDVTRYEDGVHMKDLNCLNRDLSKVIMVDWDKKAQEICPENALIIPKWDGADSDKYLIDLAMMLRTIATSGVSDVRDVLEHYRQYEDPIEIFREKQRILQEQQEELIRANQEAEQKKLTKGWTSGLFKKRF